MATETVMIDHTKETLRDKAGAVVKILAEAIESAEHVLERHQDGDEQRPAHEGSLWQLGDLLQDIRNDAEYLKSLVHQIEEAV